MAISKSDRNQAKELIKAQIRAQIQEFEREHALYLEGSKAETRKMVERNLGIDALMKKLRKMKEQVNNLENLIGHTVIGRDATWYTIDNELSRLTQKQEAQYHETTEVGRKLNALRKRFNDVDRRIFLATAHEDLVALVREYEEEV